ncbi:Hypothetical protein FKW44_024652, partial [Caligus rogercresseyi]
LNLDPINMNRCNSCPFVTKYPQSLRNHYKNMHSKSVEETRDLCPGCGKTFAHISVHRWVCKASDTSTIQDSVSREILEASKSRTVLL